MFPCFWLVSVMAVQKGFGLGVAAPASKVLTLGGFLSGSARVLGIGSMSQSQMMTLFITVMIAIVAFYVWVLVLLARNGKKLSRAFIIGASVGLCLWLLFVPPILAKDLFNYAFYGRALAVYGRNPATTVPAAFPSDPALRFISWQHTPSVYGPLFNAIAGGTVLLSGKGAVANVIAFKLLALAFFIGSLFVVDSLARRMHAGKRAFILAAVAFNPLLIIHLVGGGHNDTIMIFLLVLAFLLYRQERPVLAVSSAVLSVLIKTTAVFVLIPMLVLFLRQNARWPLRKYGQAALAVVGLPLLFYLPMWPGVSGLKRIISVGSDFNQVSVPKFFSVYVEKALHGLGMHTTNAASLGGSLARGAFMLAFLAVLVFCCWKVRDLDSLLFYSGVILFAFLMSTPWLMPWYAGMVIAVAALSGSYLLTGAAVGMTAVISLYGSGINKWPFQTYPVLLLLITAGILLLGVLKYRPEWRPRSAEGELVPPES